MLITSSTDIGGGRCQFTATLNGYGFDHEISGVISPATPNNGSLLVVRNDVASGCKNRLFGTVQQIAANPGFNLPGGLLFSITSSEPGCGMGDDHKEERRWRKV
ncbi:MAG TPA: hypothetical protein VER03_03890 [Bryobacteraceae bacterium]|nr:hypothetical protein [Bryobacteraceae bacterium]